MSNTKILLGLFFLLLVQNIFAQSKIFFDANWKKTEEKKASFYRLVEQKNDSLYFVKSFYINGNLQMEGQYSNLERETFDGLIKWYNKDGKIIESIHYNKGNADGETINYLNNGSLILKGEYKKGLPLDGFIKDECNCPIAFTNYKAGKKQFRKLYYKNSLQLASETIYRPDGFSILAIKYFDKQNNSIAQLNYSNKEESYYRRYQGTEIKFWEENKQAVSVKIKKNYVKGKWEGEETSYDKNGNIWFTAFYKNGNRHDGDFLIGSRVLRFENGVQIGESLYDQSQKKIAEIIYKDGSAYDGVKINISAHPGADALVSYEKGELVKWESFFDNDFKNIKERTVYNGNESTTYYYNEQGDLKGSGYYNQRPISGLHIEGGIETHYKDAKKDGIEKQYRFDEVLMATTLFKNDSIIWKKTKKLLEEGFHHCDYKNNEAYNGTVHKYTDEIHYQNGHQIKSIIYDGNISIGDIIPKPIKITWFDPITHQLSKETVQEEKESFTMEYRNGKAYNGAYWKNRKEFFSYKNGKKEGKYINKNKEELSNFGLEQIEGVYKNEQAYDGTFVYNKGQGFILLSNYSKGQKEGMEIFHAINVIDSSYTDTLYYHNGKITHGVKIDTLLNKEYSYFKHIYKNGKKLNSIVVGSWQNESVLYTKKGFIVSDGKTGSMHLEAEVIFHNKKNTKGKVKYKQAGKLVGTFHFNNRKVKKGKLKYLKKEGNKVETYNISVQKEKLLTTVTPEEKVGFYSKLITDNSLPKKLNYKEYKFILSGLLFSKTSNLITNQYLNDGSLLATVELIDDIPNGFLVIYKKDFRGTFSYSIILFNEDNPLPISHLNYKKLLIETAKLLNLKK